jgi:hypothetical protein
VDRKFLGYLLTPYEIWARAYSQYIAVRSGDPEMLDQVSRLRTRSGGLYYPTQWDDADFEPIARAIDELMIQLGWRKGSKEEQQRKQSR